MLAAAVGAPPILARIGRAVVAAVMVFYAVENFLRPLHVPGVPLEKLTPAWMPGAVSIAILTGIVLLLGGISLLIPRTRELAAAIAGSYLVLLSVVFYGPILISEVRTPLAIEGINYIGDTMLFAGAVLLAGWSSSITRYEARHA